MQSSATMGPHGKPTHPSSAEPGREGKGRPGWTVVRSRIPNRRPGSQGCGLARFQPWVSETGHVIHASADTGLFDQIARGRSGL